MGAFGILLVTVPMNENKDLEWFNKKNINLQRSVRALGSKQKIFGYFTSTVILDYNTRTCTHLHFLNISIVISQETRDFA